MALTKFATRGSLAGALLVSCALYGRVAGSGPEPNLWDKMANAVGAGRRQGRAPEAARKLRSLSGDRASSPRRRPKDPLGGQAAPRSQTPTPRRAPSPGLSATIVLGKVGFGAKTIASSIDYSERQKLAVPQTATCRRLRPQPERR